MANRLLMWTETLNKWVYVSDDPIYRFLHGGPRRIGDEDEIYTKSGRRVRVMLCSVKGAGKKPSKWLVEVKRG